MNDQKSKTYTQMILKSLLNDGIITINQLADEIGLSEKTIRTKIEMINNMLLENDLGKIQKKPRIGVWLEADDNQKKRLIEIVQTSSGIEPVQSDVARVSMAMKYILKISKNNALTTKRLSDMLYLSVPTTLKIINECKEWLRMFNIDLNIVRNKGLELHYNEISYRLALKNYIVKFDTELSIDEKILFFMPGLDLDAIKKDIINTETEWGFEFAEESFNEILIYVCLAIYQNQHIRNGKLKPSAEEFAMLQQYNEYNFATAIFKKIAVRFSIKITNEEIAFLSIQILCSKLIDTNYSSDTGELLREYDNRLKDFVKKIIHVVSDVLNVDLTHDETLYHGLLIHLKPTIFRLRYDRGHVNKLTSYLKTEYKQTFRVAWLLSVLFDEYFDLKVTEDELGFIVLYIQSALERNKNPMNAVLVTKTSMGINQLLCEKIRKAFSVIHKIKIISFHDFDITRYDNYNLILTTVKLNVKDDRIVEIDDLLSQPSIQKLDSKIQLLLNVSGELDVKFDTSCQQMFEPSLIFTKLKMDNKETLIRFLCDKLVKQGYVTKKYVYSVLERENYTATSIGNGIAIPHGDQNEVNEAKVVIATLDKPILWDTEEVDVIFLLVVKMTNDFEIQRTQAFYKQYVNLIGSDEKVNILRSFNDNIAFYKYLLR